MLRFMRLSTSIGFAALPGADRTGRTACGPVNSRLAIELNVAFSMIRSAAGLEDQLAPVAASGSVRIFGGYFGTAVERFRSVVPSGRFHQWILAVPFGP